MNDLKIIARLFRDLENNLGEMDFRQDYKIIPDILTEAKYHLERAEKQVPVALLDCRDRLEKLQINIIKILYEMSEENPRFEKFKKANHVIRDIVIEIQNLESESHIKFE